MKYQKKNFLSLLEGFEKEYLEIAKKKEVEYDKWRKAFIAEYPRSSILSIQINDYLISRDRNNNSFCRRICSGLKNVFHINVGNNAWEEIFGIAVKNVMQMTLSKSLTTKFGNDYIMCPNHDRLFDLGLITFADDGKIIIADRLSEDDRNVLNVGTDMKILITYENKKYLQYHRKNVFKNA